MVVFSRVLSWLCLLLLAQAGCRKPAPAPLATITGVDGKVSVVPKGKTAAEPVTGAGRGLFLEDTVTTGEDSNARLLFRGGSKINLRSNSSLVIRPVGAATAEVGAVLLAGDVEAQGGGKGSELALQTPFGVAQLGFTTAAIEVGVEQGVRVNVGTIEFKDQSGANKTLEAGKSVVLKGLEIDIADTKTTGLDFTFTKRSKKNLRFATTPMNFFLRRSGSSKFVTPQKGETLEPGDVLKVQGAKKGPAELTLDDGSVLHLADNSEVRLLEGMPKDAKYGMEISGAGTLSSPNDGNYRVLMAAGQRFNVRASEGPSNLSIDSHGDNGQVAVRSGVVTLPDNTEIEAGTKLRVNDGVLGRTEPLVKMAMPVSNNSNNTVVYYSGKPPPVKLQWVPSVSGPSLVEVAKDANFTKVVLAEKLTRPSLPTDALAPGTYFWRVNRNNATMRTLKIAPEATAECKNCKSQQLAQDTGGKTVMHFSQTLPTVSLKWQKTPGASKYHIQVFADGHLDEEPMVDTRVSATEKSFPAGFFQDGRYFWLVTPETSAGKGLKVPQMNTLVMSFDNTANGLAIRLPKNEAKVRGESIITRGEASLGAHVYINNKEIQTDRKGRFNTMVYVQKGRNQLMYRLITPDGAERLYVREVTVQ